MPAFLKSKWTWIGLVLIVVALGGFTVMQGNAAKKKEADEKAAAERDKKILEKKIKKAEAEEKLARLAEEIKSTEDAIYAAADRERSAREEIATAEEKRAGMLKQSISDWIAAQQEEEKGQEAVEKQNAKDTRRADRLRGKQDRGVRLSERGSIHAPRVGRDIKQRVYDVR